MGSGCFKWCLDKTTRGSGLILKHRKLHWHVRKNFTVRVTKHWNRLTRKVAETPFLEILNILSVQDYPPWSRGLGLDDPKRSLPTSTILWFCETKHVQKQFSQGGNNFRRCKTLSLVLLVLLRLQAHNEHHLELQSAVWPLVAKVSMWAIMTHSMTAYCYLFLLISRWNFLKLLRTPAPVQLGFNPWVPPACLRPQGNMAGWCHWGLHWFVTSHTALRPQLHLLHCHLLRTVSC